MSDLDLHSAHDSPQVPQAPQEPLQETPYIYVPEEEFGAAGELSAELENEEKNLVWYLVRQVRPGMDLSSIVLPTFILEPRSFLDKLTDSYYHADIISRAVLEDDPFNRMKTIVQWYMSGFYKKPKGLKKPYNPVLGETFRCYWEHPNGSRTYYIAEQVSHHPPKSAYYVINRRDGFCISCNILTLSRFYGNSISAILDGEATLTLLTRGEKYTFNSPYAYFKGVMLGTLTMELSGKVRIECEDTRFRTDIEFKLKPFLGGLDKSNLIVGTIALGKETLASLYGHWDNQINIKNSSGTETVLFKASPEIIQQRLKRFVVPLASQGPTESERLWQHVSGAIRRNDQDGATAEKTALEEVQRKARRSNKNEWVPVHFEKNVNTEQWVYKYIDMRPWDPMTDIKEYEYDYRVHTRTRRGESTLCNNNINAMYNSNLSITTRAAACSVCDQLDCTLNTDSSSSSGFLDEIEENK